MYTKQCVPFDRCILPIPISFENGPSLKLIPISLKDKDEMTCRIFIFDVALFYTF